MTPNNDGGVGFSTSRSWGYRGTPPSAECVRDPQYMNRYSRGNYEQQGREEDDFSPIPLSSDRSQSDPPYIFEYHRSENPSSVQNEIIAQASPLDSAARLAPPLPARQNEIDCSYRNRQTRVQPPSAGLPIFPGMKVVLPDEHGRDKKYYVEYKCYSMKKAEAEEYIDSLTKPWKKRPKWSHRSLPVEAATAS